MHVLEGDKKRNVNSLQIERRLSTHNTPAEQVIQTTGRVLCNRPQKEGSRMISHLICGIGDSHYTMSSPSTTARVHERRDINAVYYPVGPWRCRCVRAGSC